MFILALLLLPTLTIGGVADSQAGEETNVGKNGAAWGKAVDHAIQGMYYGGSYKYSAPFAEAAKEDCIANTSWDCHYKKKYHGDETPKYEWCLQPGNSYYTCDHKSYVASTRYYACCENNHILDKASKTVKNKGFKLVKKNVECRSRDANMKEQDDVVACANAVRDNGGRFFVYGKGDKKGKCYMESTTSASCPEGWETDDYDFYDAKASITDSNYLHCVDGSCVIRD